MQAAAPAARRRAALRFLIATIAVTGLYLAVQQLQLSLVGAAARKGWFAGNPTAELAGEAREVAERSAAAEAKLTPQHAVAAWQLGYMLGMLSQVLGGYAGQDNEAVARFRASVESELQPLAMFLGVGPVAPLPVRTARDFAQIRERMEADEWGLAAKVEAATSPRIGHLFMLGLQVGITAASMNTPRLLPLPPAKLIGRHATLAGLPPESWEPLTRIDQSGDAKAAGEAYLAAVSRLEAVIAGR